MAFTNQPEWAKKYTNEQLENALAASYTAARDVSYLFDAEKQARIAESRRQIEEEMQRRGMI